MKRYTAFISSVYEELKDEREEIIHSLLKRKVFPISMEYFVVDSARGFEALKVLIDEADCMILLLGDKYGSKDSDGIAWTEKEYAYAVARKIPVCAILLPECVSLKNKDIGKLDPDEKKQLHFANSILMPKQIVDKKDISSVVDSFFATIVEPECWGWTRVVCGSKLEWEKNNKKYDFHGEWYHVHLMDNDPNYIRIGTVNISQEFTPDSYTKLKLSGNNYGCKYEKKHIVVEYTEASKFNGDYSLNVNDAEILGVFSSTRMFGNREQKKGLHMFSIVKDSNGSILLRGTFHDAAPSSRFGDIYLFRKEQDRDDFLIRTRFVKNKTV